MISTLLHDSEEDDDCLLCDPELFGGQEECDVELCRRGTERADFKHKGEDWRNVGPCHVCGEQKPNKCNHVRARCGGDYLLSAGDLHYAGSSSLLQVRHNQHKNRPTKSSIKIVDKKHTYNIQHRWVLVTTKDAFWSFLRRMEQKLIDSLHGRCFNLRRARPELKDSEEHKEFLRQHLPDDDEFSQLEIEYAATKRRYADNARKLKSANKRRDEKNRKAREKVVYLPDGTQKKANAVRVAKHRAKRKAEAGEIVNHCEEVKISNANKRKRSDEERQRARKRPKCKM